MTDLTLVTEVTTSTIGNFTLAAGEQLLVNDIDISTPSIASAVATDSGMRITDDGQIRFIVGGVQRGKWTATDFDIDIPINAANGTAAEPSYTFDTDMNTGMYLKSGDNIGFSTNSVDRLILSPTGAIFSGPVFLPSFTVGTLPAATTAGGLIYVSDETGGAVLAFSDGADWRRVTDRAVVA